MTALVSNMSNYKTSTTIQEFFNQRIINQVNLIQVSNIQTYEPRKPAMRTLITKRK